MHIYQNLFDTKYKTLENLQRLIKMLFSCQLDMLTV